MVNTIIARVISTGGKGSSRSTFAPPQRLYRFPDGPWAGGTAFWHGPWATRHGLQRARAGTARRPVQCTAASLAHDTARARHGLVAARWLARPRMAAPTALLAVA
jgi:hypothetical protein